jgi:hypothetical protein
VSLRPRELLVGGSVWTYSAFLLHLERRLNLARLHKAQDALQLAYSMPNLSQGLRVSTDEQTRAAASWVKIVAVNQSQNR